MHVEADWLSRPAPEGARLGALAFLDDVRQARERLGDEGDAEALHDFRVALRRLRSWLRAFADELAGGVPGGAARRLAKVARSTNGARDGEVHLAWLAGERGSLGADELPGADWLAARLEDDRRAELARLDHSVHRGLGRARRRLERRLATYRSVVDLRGGAPRGTTLAAAAAGLVREQADRLTRAIGAVAAVDDVGEAHGARIEAKRLRYLVEPFEREVEGARDLVARLSALQDALGDLHDAAVFGDELARLAPEAGVAEQAGVAALAARLERRGADAFAAAARDWLPAERVARLTSDAERVADLVAAAAGTEIERKLLLDALPDEARRAPSSEVEQGYLPGRRLVERVRRVREAGGAERFYRTVKVGSGERRTELEEETTRELFDALWPFTEGRRVRKRRHVVADGALSWEVDEFLDRPLVTAEVELEREGDAPDPPAWLRPHVVRDVTGDSTYSNATLAS